MLRLSCFPISANLKLHSAVYYILHNVHYAQCIRHFPNTKMEEWRWRILSSFIRMSASFMRRYLKYISIAAYEIVSDKNNIEICAWTHMTGRMARLRAFREIINGVVFMSCGAIEKCNFTSQKCVQSDSSPSQLPLSSKTLFTAFILFFILCFSAKSSAWTNVWHFHYARFPYLSLPYYKTFR